MYEINLDSNIIISLLVNDSHSEQVIKALSALQAQGYHVYLSLVSYAEILTGIELQTDDGKKEETRSALEGIFLPARVEIVADNVVIAERAAKAQAEYKRRGGKREVLIPDFLIGANAEFYSKKLLTTNPRDFLKFFPDLSVLTPEQFILSIQPGVQD